MNRSAAGTRASYPFPRLTVPIRHLLTLVAVCLIFALYHASGHLLDDGGLFLLLSIAVLGTAWFAGTVTAIGATVLGAILGSVSAGHAQSAAVETHLALFVLQGLLLTALVAELRRARWTAEREARIAETARREAEVVNRMKDEFLGAVSHELRTPLNAVLGWLYLIRGGKLDEANRVRGLDAIDRNVRLQAQLTSDLLDVSKSLTGRLHIDLLPVALESVIAEATSQVATAAAAKDVTLSIDEPPAPIVVRGDANRLRQVVWHLLANAIKFTPRGGAIDLRVTINDQVCVAVQDTGLGIDELFLPRIFDRFSQADASPTRTAGGLGVGLSLVRELVERHGGEIVAANRTDRHGAIFTVKLPLHREDQQVHGVAPAPAAGTASSPPLDGLRVLVLDRDLDARELQAMVLRQRGALVQTVSSVDEALEVLESWRPDVLVSDILSPDHDGYSVTGKVGSLDAERGGRIPALALTSMATADDRMRRMIASVQRSLPKPVEPAVLTAEIARLTGRERRRAPREINN